MISPSKADALIGRHLNCLPIESLPLMQCTGAVLRENVYAERDQPPFDRVAMDGVALDSSAVRDGRRRFRVQAMQAAGDAPLRLESSDAVIEIMTGASLPSGCDAVVPVEQLLRAGDAVEFDERVRVAPWQNVHRRGSDCTQGSLLLTAGSPLGAPEIAVAAGADLDALQVGARIGLGQRKTAPDFAGGEFGQP